MVIVFFIQVILDFTPLQEMLYGPQEVTLQLQRHCQWVGLSRQVKPWRPRVERLLGEFLKTIVKDSNGRKLNIGVECKS